MRGEAERQEGGQDVWDTAAMAVVEVDGEQWQGRSHIQCSLQEVAAAWAGQEWAGSRLRVRIFGKRGPITGREAHFRC